MKEEILVNQTLKGIGVSSGITMGRVRLIDRDKVAITKRSISPRQVEREVGSAGAQHDGVGAVWVGGCG